MRTFVYVGAERRNRSRIAIKFWGIERSGRVVKLRWGPARVDHQTRRIVRPEWQGKDIRHGSPQAAKQDAERRVRDQRRQGYLPLLPAPRRRRSG